MDSIRNVALSCLALVVLVALSAQAFATSATVGLCAGPGTHYTSIQLAVNAVPAGSTVKVCPGNYQEQVTITSTADIDGNCIGQMDAAVILPPSGGMAVSTDRSRHGRKSAECRGPDIRPQHQRGYDHQFNGRRHGQPVQHR